MSMMMLATAETLLLIVVLIAREYFALDPRPRARRITLVLTAAVVPLAAVFGVIAYERLLA